MHWLFVFLAFNPTIHEIFLEERAHPLKKTEESSVSIESWIDAYEIHSVLDAGCGVSPAIPKVERYIGVDIVENPASLQLDITSDPLPQSDLIFCCHTLDFFSYRDIGDALARFKESQSKYLVLNTSRREVNEETSTGIERKINFEVEPFFFPPPLDTQDDLALWNLEEIDLAPFERTTFPPVTILTKPVGGSFRAAHVGVVSSANKGLTRLGVDFNYNPDDFAEVRENVVVITDTRAGAQAYEWKLQGKIKTLTAGPNFAPSEGDAFITWPHLNCYYSNSDWPAINIIQRYPSLKDRIRIWYAGVDETFWKPKKKFREKESSKVLIYNKTDGHISEQVRICLEELGYEVVWIHYSGNAPYSLETFRNALEECKFAVFVSRSESQGIALAEAWAMDVPVLAWNPETSFDWDGHWWAPVSSCPYMNPMVGIDWKEMEQFRAIVQSFDQVSEPFSPRRWVLLNMTDKTSIERLFCHIREFSNDLKRTR